MGFIQNISASSKKWMQTTEKWNSKFDEVHHIHSPLEKNSNKLRFILGAGRSGTSWVGRTLSESTTPLRYCHEILTYINPFFYYSSKNDYTAVHYKSDLSYYAPLFKIFSYSACKDVSLKKFIPKREYQIKRDDKGFECVLHKEVHSLLGAEAIVRHFKCPVIFITRNPAYVIDSLFDYHDLKSTIWRNESNYIKEPEFQKKFLGKKGSGIVEALSKYPDDGDVRQNTIVGKAITVGAINKMLFDIAGRYENVLYVKYEKLCHNPIEVFSQIHGFLGLEFSNSEIQKLENTMSTKDEKYDPMSIYRNTKSQIGRKLKSLTSSEFDKIVFILNALGLSEDCY